MAIPNENGNILLLGSVFYMLNAKASSSSPCSVRIFAYEVFLVNDIFGEFNKCCVTQFYHWHYILVGNNGCTGFYRETEGGGLIIGLVVFGDCSILCLIISLILCMYNDC